MIKWYFVTSGLFCRGKEKANPVFGNLYTTSTRLFLPQDQNIVHLTIERFHSRDQQPYWITETKGSICIKIEFKSQRISLVHHHGRHPFVLEHQHGRRDVMWKRSIHVICLELVYIIRKRTYLLWGQIITMSNNLICLGLWLVLMLPMFV